MLKKFQTIVVFCCLFCFAFCATVRANPDLEKDAAFAEKIKTQIVKIGTGRAARVKIKLSDGTKIKGCVSRIKDTGFVLVNKETGTSREISYLQVKQVKGRNRSSGEKTFVRASIAVGVILLYGLILSRSSEY